MLETLRKRLGRDEEEGFTLIELMVVVLIIAILIAIAIPTFLGARTRAQDRQAQSNLRNAFAAEKVLYTDNQAYTSSASALSGVEPSLTYSAGTDPSGGADAKTIFVNVDSTTGVVILAAKSKSGTCWYMKDGATSPTQFTTSSTCAASTSVAGWTGAW
jgi:type IV pilus assembly protein PilA